jgi:hypothetical protein
MRAMPATTSLNPCDYHKHESKKEKKACQDKEFIEDDSDSDSGSGEDDGEDEDN